MNQQAISDLAQFIFESDAIEGIQDNLDLLARQIKMKHERGHVGAMLMLGRLAGLSINAPGYVTEKLICKVQGLITAEQHSKPGGPRLKDKYIGQFRDCPCVLMVGRVEKHRFVDPVLIPDLMGGLIQRMQWWQDNHKFKGWDYNVRAIARFHLDFETVHPFADGNGRTGRALVYYLMLWTSLRPFVFTNEDKSELYYPCFDNRTDYRPMERYFFTKMGLRYIEAV